MPFIQRFVTPINLSSSSKNDQASSSSDVVDDASAVINNHDSIQNSFVNLLRQIADLAKHSENIIMQIFNDSLNIAERWQSLERRLDAIKTNVERLDANAIEITSAGNVARFIEVEKHYSSSSNKEHDTETNRLFVVDTRPGHLKDLCQSIRRSTTLANGKKRSVLVVDFEDGSTQTDNVYRRFRRRSTHVNDDVVVAEDNTTTTSTAAAKLVSTSQVDSKHSSSASESFLLADESYFTVDQRRPTSITVVDGMSSSNIVNNNNLKKSNVENRKNLTSSSSARTGVITIEVDTSGSAALKRMSALRKSRNKICAPNDVERTTNENFSTSKIPTTAATTCDTNLLSSTTTGCSSSTKRANGVVHVDESNKKLSSTDYCRNNGDGSTANTNRAAPRNSRRCSRRNTIANVGDLKNNLSAADDKRSKQKLSTTTTINSSQSNYNVVDHDEFDSYANSTTMADEYFYDFAPFYRRRTKRSILSSVNQFFSLRRPSSSSKKNDQKSKITSSATLDDFRKSTPNAEYLNSPLIIPSSYRRHPQPQKETTPQNGLKQFFKRTLSLHLSSTRKTKNSSPSSSSNNDNDYLYESLPFRRPTKFDSPKNGYCNSSDIIGNLRQSDSNKSSSSSSCNQFSRNYSGRPKTNLPITMESQVLNIAAVLRNHRPTTKNVVTTTKQSQKSVKTSSSPSSSRDSAYSSCGKKIRPMSIVSFGSIASLDLNDKNLHNSWYRQGYQLEYPDECLNAVVVKSPVEPTTLNAVKISSPRLIVSTVPSDMFGGRKTSSSRSPYSDVSSVNDSNYSCDQEGYFTSMHRDSGLVHHLDIVNGGGVAGVNRSTTKPLVGLKDFRGRSFSTHSSSSTVAGEPNGSDDCSTEILLPNRSPADSDIVVDSSNESTSSTSFLLTEKTVDVSARRAFPPFCDVSLSESSDNETLRKNRRRYHEPSPSTTTTGNHMSAETCARIDAFDRWLLSKFQAEMTLKNQKTCDDAMIIGWGDRFSGHSLPRRRRKEPNNNEISRADACIVDQIESSVSNFNHTVPRKSVRFLD